MRGDCISNSIDVLSGVLQGSVLGPYCFLIYIDDILQHVDSTCHLYVDDCIPYQKIESAHDVIMLQIKKLSQHMMSSCCKMICVYLCKQWEKCENIF